VRKVQAFQYISLNMLMNIDMTTKDNLATLQGKGVEREEIILTKNNYFERCHIIMFR
jgi:hypothetical protein